MSSAVRSEVPPPAKRGWRRRTTKAATIVAAFVVFILVGCAVFFAFTNFEVIDPNTSWESWQGIGTILLSPCALLVFLALVMARTDELATRNINMPGSVLGHAFQQQHPLKFMSPATHRPLPSTSGTELIQATRDTSKGSSKLADLSDVQRRGIWTPAEVAARSEHDQGPYLGRFLDGGQPAGGGRPVGVIRYTGPKHLITIGPPGSNKSMGVGIPNIANLPRSQIIIDCKGQLAAMTYRKRKEMGEVIVINPFGLFVEKFPHLKSHGFNPCAGLPDGDALPAAAAKIAECVIPIAAHEHQKIFPLGARDIYTAGIMHDRRTNGAKASLVSVRNALCAPTLKDKTGRPVSGFGKFLEDMALSDYPPIANLASPIYDRYTDKNSGNTSVEDTLGTARTNTTRLDDPPIARDLQGKAIDFASFREKITTCYIILPTAKLETYGTWLRLVIGSALNALYDAPLPAPDKMLPPVYFLLDEFAALGRLEAIETALGVARDYGIQLHVLIQRLSQIKQHYPQSWDGFFNGAGAISAFAPGNRETAEYLAKLCGERTMRVHNTNINLAPDGKFTPGQSWSDQTQPLIRPEDLMRMPSGQMLCMVDPEPMPFFTAAPVYVNTPFAAGLDDNPYFRKRGE
jgi:type IV secretion system protein VirD4